LRLPESQHVGFDLADARDIADLEVETVGYCRLFLNALGGQLRGHIKLVTERALKPTPSANRSIGHNSRNKSTKIEAGRRTTNTETLLS
jgi:hypothetical protein